MTLSLDAHKLTLLKVGSLLTDFDADTTEYALTTTNNSNTVTVACDYDYIMTVNGMRIESGKSVAWKTGENILKIEVAEGYTYTVTVTKE